MVINLSKIAVVYKSKYGSTKKYAQWICEALGGDIFEASKTKVGDLQNYDTIIYGGGLYAGGINGVGLIIRNFDSIKNRKLIVFTVGLADTNVKENVLGIKRGIDKQFSTDMKQKIKFFHLRGGMDYDKLNFAHTVMMSMVRNMSSKKKDKTQEDIELLDTFGKSVDFTDKDTIAPIVEYVNLGRE